LAGRRFGCGAMSGCGFGPWDNLITALEKRFPGDNGPAGVPGRGTIIVSSVLFIIAALTLWLEFIVLYLGPAQMIYYGNEPAPWAMGNLVNILGAISCVGWVIGFWVLIDWMVVYTFPAWGVSRRGLLGAVIKIIASTLFNIQPWSALMAPTYGLPGVGVPWSNFAGICFFHVGNILDSIGMIPLFNKAAPLSVGNLPVLGMWTFMMATWFLTIAGGIGYFSTPEPWGPGMTFGSIALYVVPMQIFGSFLLLVGSLEYMYWSLFHGRASGYNQMKDNPMSA